MKANSTELMIGDYVYWNNIPCPVIQLDDQGSICVADLTQSKLSSNLHYEDENLLYIPITLNFLEQEKIEIKYLNGNNHLQYQVAHDEDKYHYVIDSIANDFGDWQYITKEIEFVHQLQQLVRIFEKREIILKF